MFFLMFQKLLANMTQSMVVVREGCLRKLVHVIGFSYRRGQSMACRMSSSRNRSHSSSRKRSVLIQETKLRKMVLKFVGTSFDPKIKQPHSGECCYSRGICIRCRATFNDEQSKEEKSLEGQEFLALQTCSYELFIDPKRVAGLFDGNLAKATNAYNRLSEAEHKEWVDIAKKFILDKEAAAKSGEKLPIWESRLEEIQMKANSRPVTRKRKASPMSSHDIEIAKWKKFCKAAEAMKKFAESKKDAEKGASSGNNAEK